MNALGNLSRCTMESNSESAASAKWLRGKSMAVSLAIEAAAVGALLLVPLLSTGVLPPLFVSTPALPYRGEPQPVRRAAPRVNPRQPTAFFNPVAAAPVRRQQEENTSSAPPAVGVTIGNQVGPAGPQPGIPGGENTGAPIPLAPPLSAPRNKPLPQSEGVMAARLVRRVQPVYPRIAEMMHLSGIVRLRAIVGTDGSVQHLEVLSGKPILARAAIDAVKQWRYEPTRLNGQPVEVETSITVTFVLN
jgi:periplasmic protein TonB